MSQFSVIILTFNEEDNIESCLNKILKVSNDVFVVDSFSTDNTIKILEKYPIKSVQNKFVNYSQQRNWAQENCPFNHEWVLHIDAGEFLTPELIHWLQHVFPTQMEKFDGFIFSRRVYFLNKWIKRGGMYPNSHLRLFKKEKGFCENKSYDQHFVVEGKINKVPLGADVIDNNGSNVNDFILKHLRWANKEAEDIISNQNTQGNVKESILGNDIERKRFLKNNLYYKFPVLWRAFFLFLYRYVFMLGFLDGKVGFIYHFLQCFWFRVTIDSIFIQFNENNK
ncbi:glycosyltransferase family 2 protein [Runella sp. SP2]|uniref:glycosyltransferase family 2 protein n=1 Tax=Runella sp. SP2 TaxID=2268026 RepID=UPI000F096068|nr:glycosyltransferase family 2 protein [Runella sp. SP2]AYQ30769.1 glycosyltransferase family 2 protein [Runella sp. SP2]